MSKELGGALFKNDNPPGSPKPVYSGNALVAGVAYYMDAWLNKRDDGSVYMSIKFKPKANQPLPADTPDSEIPF